MLSLTTQDVKMGQTLADKQAVISALAEWLEQDGNVAAGYADGMLAREAQTATYLGQGIAIPHGTQECRHLVKQTGIKALHLPDGVDWGDGEKAYLVLGIAAGSDEHLELLRRLARALSRDDLAEQVRRAESRQDILRLLQGEEESSQAPVLGWRREWMRTGVEATSLAALQRAACELLNADDTERQALQASSLHLGQGWWLSQAPASGEPRAALVTTTGFEHSGQPVRALLALAVNGNGHRPLLAQLADWLLADKGQALAAMADSTALHTALARGPHAPGEDGLADNQRLVVVRNHQGLHARPGAMMVQIAKQFEADIRVRNLDGDGHDVNGKSLMKLIGLGVRPGHQLLLTAEGPDAAAALEQLVTAINEGLGEDVMPVAAGPTLVHQVQDIAPDTEMRGVGASPGTAIGPLFVEVPVHFDYPDTACDAGAEQRRLKAALAQADTDLAAAAEATHEPQARDILSMHRELLGDPALAEGAQARLQRGASAPAAWWSEIDSAATRQAASPNAMLAERAADIRDIGRRVMAILCDTPLPQTPNAPYIWVAEDIGPSDVVNMNAELVLGLVTAGGGPSSHSAILARSLGIPALVAMGGAVMGLKSGTQAILNGDAGTLHVAPTNRVLEQAKARQAQERQLAEQAWEHRNQAAVTTDGHRLEVGANLGDTAKTAAAVESGAEGVGLLRTEFVFMGRSQAPDLAQQQAEYDKAFTVLNGRPLVARTLDVGGDKPLPYWPVPKEDNPFLGVRGIRLCMQQPELLETQLRALLTAAGDRPLRIMFPMVADWSEWRFAKEMFERVQAEVQAADVQLGIMVEVPSAALNAQLFAQDADFFSIGTNDLTQYTLAADRGNGELAALSDGLHPAVLRLIAMTVEAAHAQGKWVGVCGELGADPQALPLLLGLGVDEVSVSPGRVPLVKARVRECSLARCKDLAAKALRARDAQTVRALTGEIQ
ncbi:phosphoenolpyruvate--protein phosphotransferase [Oceanimonas doudoroffii]|uniref:phosphoenolpyruvate--protein phosphotransferase n=1 Tax=Oceanimonas doudoroffii TaxID=84158 RepID=A0A233RFC1_9GAMM|nr:phosphoenolpyruvate--protein phosphotransferase [Oceanimonas doudoroffii]OXY82079.1 phosphoenolpyruvate--protein phosphotransferase [Oceanimonas doudoroffii]